MIYFILYVIGVVLLLWVLRIDYKANLDDPRKDADKELKDALGYVYTWPFWAFLLFIMVCFGALQWIVTGKP